MRTIRCLIALLALAPAAFAPSPAAAENLRATRPFLPAHDAGRDFDALAGTWTVVQRRRVGTGWETSTGTATIAARADAARTDAVDTAGGANAADLRIDDPAHGGVATRAFDPRRQTWSIRWADAHDTAPALVATGRFADGVGDFYGDGVRDGVPVRVHYRWSDMTPTSARWVRSTSDDGGRTWQVRWTMEFARPAAPFDATVRTAGVTPPR